MKSQQAQREINKRVEKLILIKIKKNWEDFPQQKHRKENFCKHRDEVVSPNWKVFPLCCNEFEKRSDVIAKREENSIKQKGKKENLLNLTEFIAASLKWKRTD